MFLWWSDPYVYISIASLVLSLFLLVHLVRAVQRKQRLHFGGKILIALWLVAVIPWLYITSNVLRLSGMPMRKAEPRLKFTSADGKLVALDSLKGRVVLLDFWATWCAPCRASEPAITALQQLYGDRLTVVGVSFDEEEDTWRRYLNRHTRRSLDTLDSHGSLAELFDVQARPTFVLIDRTGDIRWQQLGWTPYSYLVLRYRIGTLLLSRSSILPHLPKDLAQDTQPCFGIASRQPHAAYQPPQFQFT